MDSKPYKSCVGEPPWPLYIFCSLSWFGCTAANPDYIGANADLSWGPVAVDLATPPPTLDLDSPPLRIFVTQTDYQGDTVSDDLCKAAASAGRLGGRWVTWLSTIDFTGSDAIDRIPAQGPWYDLNGTLIFRSKSDLQAQPRAGIQVDERRLLVKDGSPIWTGTLPGGKRSQNLCYNLIKARVWYDASITAYGDVGRTGRTDSSWTYDGPIDCNQRAHVLCLEY